MKKLVLFGAGKIGRSFIGQLFGQSGYEVVFIDINENIVSELNRKREYKVIIKSNASDETILIKNVRGVSGTHKEQVVAELISCDLAAVSVGQRGLTAIVPMLAEGIKERHKKGLKPLDIIIAENMRNADEFIRSGILKDLGNDFPVNDYVGLIETSIGKMVPIIPDEQLKKDPLLIFAEPYNTLILDKKAFKNKIPDVNGLAPKENIKAWVDRKSYIHNLGHAAAAYSGFLAEPAEKYLSGVLINPFVKEFTRNAMQQSAKILMKKYPEEFSELELSEHIEDLLSRFENKALGDTVFRIGCDLKRKLYKKDRVLSPLIDGIESNSEVNYLKLTFAYSLCFKAKDLNGKMMDEDVDFFRLLYKNGLLFILKEICGLDQVSDKQVIESILSTIWDVTPINLTLEKIFSDSIIFQV